MVYNCPEFFSSSLLDRAWQQRVKYTTAKACCCPVGGICVTVWTWTAWAASTRAPTAAPASVV